MPSDFNYRLRKLKRATVARLALLSPRFDPLLKTDAPLERMDYPGAEETHDLIVFLPGIGDLAEDFERRGFIGDRRALRLLRFPRNTREAHRGCGEFGARGRLRKNMAGRHFARRIRRGLVCGAPCL